MLFELKPRVAQKIRDAELVKKAKARTPKPNNSTALIDTIYAIKEDIEKNLGEFKDKYAIIDTIEELDLFIENANKAGILSIDTETDGLNPMVDDIVGVCLYSVNQKPSYVPINHIDYITGVRCENQLTEDEVRISLEKITAKVIMFNATFDIRFLRNQVGYYATCYWDCLLAAKLMNENEPSSTLKTLHQKYILLNQKDAKSFSDLFKNVPIKYIPIQYAFLYAANDAVITYELYEFQKKYLNPQGRKDLVDVYHLFMEIEMPCVNVVCDLEDSGVCIDNEYIQNYLSPKYHKYLKETLEECYAEIAKYQVQLDDYTRKNVNHKLSDPINIGSPTQLSIVLYDIMRQPIIDKTKPRGTGEDILLRMDTSFTRAVLKYRSAQKLLGTYIDKMPNVMLKDGKVHCRFNQYGGKTGRFSSSDPNLQNIPNTKEIRQMFIAGTDEIVHTNEKTFIFSKAEEIETTEGWKFVETLNIGDIIDTYTVESIQIEDGLLGQVVVTFSH